MKYAWLDAYCLAKKGVQKDYKPEWDAVRYMVKDKMFVLQGGDKEGRPIITVKLEPSLGALLRQQFSDITPGYYMNKEHWNSLYLEGDVPDEIVKDMLDMSYDLVLSSLSKKLQKEILEMRRNPFEIRDHCRRNLVKYTIQAFSMIPRIDDCKILDLGCGTGEPTMALLEACDGQIYAVDSDPVSISALREKAEASKSVDRINVIQGSALDPNLLPDRFDIVLAEGLLNVIGFDAGFPVLLRYVKKNGYLILHDELVDDAEKRALFRENGLELLGAFELDENVWWNEYYSCLEKLVGNAEDAAFQSEMDEINEFKKNPEHCRSIYYILKHA